MANINRMVQMIVQMIKLVDGFIRFYFLFCILSKLAKPTPFKEFFLATVCRPSAEGMSSLITVVL